MHDLAPADIGKSSLDGPYHPVLAAAHVSVPAHFAIALDDEMPGASPMIARTAYGRLAEANELLEIEGGHFGLSTTQARSSTE